jgi:beta-lactamase class D
VTPASTFKIPNSAIALETGVADGPGFTLEWDPVRDPRRGDWPDAWAGPQTLRSAFSESCVWYFQELARRIGRDRMSSWVAKFGYGNGSSGLAGPIDRFWLDGSLVISADEQVAFLERMLSGRLGLSARTTGIVRELAFLEKVGEAVLSGKTGTMPTGGGRQLGWIVGWVETGGKTFVYAMNAEAPRESSWSRAERVSRTREMLAAAGILPPAAAKITTTPR